ncbi:MAG: tRNA pseudouridine(38-40) synthase TruA [Muribaculaceae bacterium]|nr:tRNA pseudouridine(38-40) synthase TruA [Muribaculaceae bacterium]
MRYFIKLSYRGEAFHGWQVQPHDPSVQETIEKALSTLLHVPTPLTGAGRTDTGVNARLMVAHFDTQEPIADARHFVHSLNGIVGRDIAIHSIHPVHDNAHARFDATSRTYKYFVHTSKSPFLYPLSWWCRPDLDFALMNEAAARLLDYRDFTSFSKLHTDVKTNNCVITQAQWKQNGEQWVFTITADRFLRNMVRAIVGTLVDVGTHKIGVDDFCRIIERRDRCAAGTSMPGHALFLWDITYPYTY